MEKSSNDLPEYKYQMTTAEQIRIIRNMGGTVRVDILKDGHPALSNHRAMYVISDAPDKWVDSRMTGWGVDDDMATDNMYNNIKEMLWDMVKEIE